MEWKTIAVSVAAGVLASATAVAAQNPGAGATAGDPARQTQAEAPISADRLAETDVRQLQQSLNREGFNAGPVDGILGPMTQRALRDFQEDRGLEPSGDLNRDTIVALGFEPAEFAAAEFDPSSLSEEDVRQVQQALNQEGFNAGPVDGIMGPQTRGALRDFQQDNGLEPTGELDRESVLALGLPIAEFAAGEFADSPDDAGRDAD